MEGEVFPDENVRCMTKTTKCGSSIAALVAAANGVVAAKQQKHAAVNEPNEPCGNATHICIPSLWGAQKTLKRPAES
jgi:hypothetical protein